MVAKRGVVVHLETSGYQNLQKKPMAIDSLFRIYYMTKPITEAALMMLFEQGLFRPEDPLKKGISP